MRRFISFATPDDVTGFPAYILSPPLPGPSVREPVGHGMNEFVNQGVPQGSLRILQGVAGNLNVIIILGIFLYTSLGTTSTIVAMRARQYHFRTDGIGNGASYFLQQHDALCEHLVEPRIRLRPLPFLIRTVVSAVTVFADNLIVIVENPTLDLQFLIERQRRGQNEDDEDQAKDLLPHHILQRLQVKIPSVDPNRGLVHKLRLEGMLTGNRHTFPDLAGIVNVLPLATEAGADILLRYLQGCAAVAVRGGLDHDGHLVNVAVGIQRVGGGAEGLGIGLRSRLALIAVVRGIVLDLRRGDGGNCEEAEEEDEFFHDTYDITGSFNLLRLG